VDAYKNNQASLSTLLACTQQYNLTHSVTEQQQLSELVSCVDDYKNGTKTLSELLGCIQTFNQAQNP